MAKRTYLAIALKAFYASVECIVRGLDPMTINLVVANISRTEKIICFAVLCALKAYGILGRARLFEIVQKLKKQISSGSATRRDTDSQALFHRLRSWGIVLLWR